MANERMIKARNRFEFKKQNMVDMINYKSLESNNIFIKGDTEG